jgi:hypothetical protein
MPPQWRQSLVRALAQRAGIPLTSGCGRLGRGAAGSVRPAAASTVQQLLAAACDVPATRRAWPSQCPRHPAGRPFPHAPPPPATHTPPPCQCRRRSTRSRPRPSPPSQSTGSSSGEVAGEAQRPGGGGARLRRPAASRRHLAGPFGRSARRRDTPRGGRVRPSWRPQRRSPGRGSGAAAPWSPGDAARPKTLKFLAPSPPSLLPHTRPIPSPLAAAVLRPPTRAP